MQNKNLPVAIIGGGPIGLAAAAHLVENDIPFQLFESGNSVGHNILSWKHITVFSPWQYNMDKAAIRLLSRAGWDKPQDDLLPTGEAIVEKYLRPLANLPTIQPFIHYGSKVLSVGRKGMDKMKTKGRDSLPFLLHLQKNGNTTYFEASAVIDATGTWNQPNPIGAGGRFAEGELELNSKIFYGIPDVKNKHLDRYKNKNVLVVGSGHSAVNTLLDLAAVQLEYPDTQLQWVLRKNDLSEVYGGQEKDALAARGLLGSKIELLVNSGKLDVHTPFQVMKLTEREEGIEIEGQIHNQRHVISGVDAIVSNTGSRPNLDMIREVRVDLDASLESVFDLAELIDPNLHSCGTVRPHGEKELRHPESNFYIVGSKSYGRAPTFLMATGYEQVRSVVAHLAGDHEAAGRVELDLPETGVCTAPKLETACC